MTTPHAEPTGTAEPSIPRTSSAMFFLQLANIPGPAKNVGFVGHIPLLTWGWGVDSTGTVIGGGGGAGRATPQEFVFQAKSDLHSPKILAAVNTGQRLQTALLSCVKSGERPVTFLTLKLDDLVLTSYYVSPDATNGAPLDSVRLKFARVTHRFVTQNPDGSTSPTQSAFDYRTNASF
jgi:type VI secretion system secreted protein Hcp